MAEESVVRLAFLPTPTRTARIILLHGASSAGKSTLSRAIQQALDEPFLYFASDILAVGLPARRDPDGPFLWWGNVRPRFFAGFHASIAAFAAAGNDLCEWSSAVRDKRSSSERGDNHLTLELYPMQSRD